MNIIVGLSFFYVKMPLLILRCVCFVLKNLLIPRMANKQILPNFWAILIVKSDNKV